MFTERIRAGTAALLLSLLPAGLAACATAGEDGPFLREDIPWNEPAGSPFLNDPLFGDPRYEYELDWYANLNEARFPDAAAGPEPYPGNPRGDEGLPGAAPPPPPARPVSAPRSENPKPWPRTRR